MPRRFALVLALALLGPLAGCASSRILLDAPVLPGESELYAATEEQVLEATRATVQAAGLRVDEMVEGPGVERRTVLASRGWSWWDYGAIARVIVEPADAPEDGIWVRVTSRLKVTTNVAGKGDYREDILGGVHGALVGRRGGAAPPLPASVLAPRVSDPLVVGTPLRLRGRRYVVRALEAGEMTLDDGLGTSPRRVSADLSQLADAERLIREPYHWERLVLASALGVGLGFLFAELYDSDLYGDLGWVYGVTFGVTGVTVGAAWANRGRTRWQPVP